MSSILAQKSDVLDDTDRRIIHALQLDPRAGFSRIGAVLGVSEQTVARRFRRLRADGLLRIVGLVDARHLGQSEWLGRGGCRPGGGTALGDAPGRRGDAARGAPRAGGAAVGPLVLS